MKKDDSHKDVLAQHEVEHDAAYSLEELLEQCTPEKRHDAVEFEIAGKELI